MSIHFAGSRRPSRSPLARCLSAPRAMQADNDNGRAIADNAVLRATLVHFAQHGLRAASDARVKAEDAYLAGDGESYRHWLSVCRTLDRRMAARPAQRG